MSTWKRQPWLLFDPDGAFDGLIWSPETADEAGRKLFGRKQSWVSHQRKGWTIRRGVDDEHLRLIQERRAALTNIGGVS